MNFSPDLLDRAHEFVDLSIGMAKLIGKLEIILFKQATKWL